MNQFDYQEFYDRNLPHFHPPGATLFLTFRLAGSLPQAVVREYQARKEWLLNEVRRVERQARGDAAPARAQHLTELRAFRREWFAKFEEALHQEQSGPVWLKEEKIARIVADSLHYLDGKSYRLDAYSVMSNHVHAVFAPYLAEAELREVLTDEGLLLASDAPSLAKIMQSLKGYTARQANRALSRQGQFWQHESYDHVVRPGEFNRIVNYTLNNPVKAGLVAQWEDWPWNYRRQ